MDRKTLEIITLLRFHALKLQIAEAEYEATKEFINENKNNFAADVLESSKEHLEILRTHFKELKNMLPAELFK